MQIPGVPEKPRDSSNFVAAEEGGRLAESGTREELLAKNGIYASMIRTKRSMEARPATAGSPPPP